MFNMLEIDDILTNGIGLENIQVNESYLFTMKHDSYTNLYNNNGVIIGQIPYGYSMFFKFTSESFFEDVGVEELQRFTETGLEVELLGYNAKTNKIQVISNNDIAKFELVEEQITVPFTNYAVESEGIFIFKNINSLATALLDDDKRNDELDVEED